MVIGTVHSKSVGKTTLAVHLAAWLSVYGYEVAVIDADWQQQSSNWLNGDAPNITTHVIQDPSKITKVVPRLHEEFQVVIVDGPAGLDNTAGAVLSVSDAVIVPCGPTATEIKALKMVANTINQVQEFRKGRDGEPKPGAIIVPVRTHSKRNNTKALLSEASKLGFVVTHKQVPSRESYARLAGMPGEEPQLLWQLGRSKDVKRAVMELDALFQEMFPEASEHDPNVMARLMDKPNRKGKLNNKSERDHEQERLVANA